MPEPFPEAYRTTLFDGPGALPPWPSSFVIVTAWATTGQQWSEARNRHALAQLARELDERGRDHRPILGRAPDGSHAEPSWLIPMSLEDGRELGRRYRQHAIYWVTDDVLHVAICDAGSSAPWPIGSFRARTVHPDASPAD